MSTSRGKVDVEKGEPDEENWALLGARNEGRQDDGEHLTRADDVELADFEKPGPSSSNTAKSDVSIEESNQLQEPVLLEETIESEEDELQKQRDQNSSIFEAIYNYKDKELIRWLEEIRVSNPCPFPILRAACQAQSNEEALQILLDAGKGPEIFAITPLHAAAVTNEPMSIETILGVPEDLKNKETYAYRKPSVYQLTNYFASIPLGYTALHVASAYAHSQGVRLLLAAGANPNLRDMSNSTPLDVAGVRTSRPDYTVQSYEKTLQLLLKNGGRLSEVESSNTLLLERALRKRSPLALTLLLDAGASFDPRNPSGSKLMRLCVELKLQEHLEVLLAYQSSPELDYRPVDVTDEEGSTVLHWAACERWLDGVTIALLARADVTAKNSAGDTALHLAAKAGDYDIVKQIIDFDTSAKCDFLMENIAGECPLSYAIISGNADIVKYMTPLCVEMLFTYSTIEVKDLSPLEYSAEKNFQELFNFFINRAILDGEDIMRILYILAKNDFSELFFEFQKSPYRPFLEIIITTNEYCILHEAAKNGSKEMIMVLIREGADLSERNDDGQTAMSLLMDHVPKPTELLTEVLDGCISSSTDKNINDKDCVITINYSVLKPVNKHEKRGSHDDVDDMKVLEALLETRDVYNHRSLLTHPVVESFLYLKWKKCAKFIYFLISAYVLFLISFNTFIVTIFYHMDHKIKEQDIFFIFKPTFWRLAGIFSFLIFLLVDIFYISSSKTKWYRNKTIWLKLLLIAGGLIMICMPMDTADTDIVRGVAVITVSLSWMYLMILLSWTPTLGYYMQMYGKVSKNVIKVMLSFSFPLVGFSICFMILLRSREPFDGPIAAFLKTMAMMSSEFEYENLVKNTTTDSTTDAKNSTLTSFEYATLTSVFMLRIFFLLFLICVAVVLMNLMLGVAVSDFQKLSHDGQQRRLMKQIECITALERLFQRKPFSSLKLTETKTWKVPSEVKVKPDSKIFGKELKEIILSKAQSLKETKEKKLNEIGMKAKIDDMYDLTKKQSDLEKELSEIKKSLNTISEAVALKDLKEKKILKAVDDSLKEKKSNDIGMKAKIDDMYDLTKKQSYLEKELSEIKKSVNKISEAVVMKDASAKR